MRRRLFAAERVDGYGALVDFVHRRKHRVEYHLGVFAHARQNRAEDYPVNAAERVVGDHYERALRRNFRYILGVGLEFYAEDVDGPLEKVAPVVHGVEAAIGVVEAAEAEKRLNRLFREPEKPREQRVFYAGAQVYDLFSSLAHGKKVWQAALRKSILFGKFVFKGVFEGLPGGDYYIVRRPHGPPDFAARVL